MTIAQIALVSVGAIFVLLGIIHAALKYLVIRTSARTHMDGGVPVMDFVIFVLLWLSFGTSLVLGSFDIRIFPFFGVALYVALAAILWGVMELEYRRGKPFADAELANAKKHAAEAQARGDHSANHTADQ